MIETLVEPAPGSTALLRLCQLVSPALPIGAYNFSQGLEYAVHAGWVQDEASTASWVRGVASHAVGTLDVPILLRMHSAWQTGSEESARQWSARLLAARESEELRAEDRHLGRSLAKVLVTLGIADAADWVSHRDATHACLFALAAARWSIGAPQAAQAYLWSWCENQVIAAVKLLPLGQSAGLRVLNQLLPAIPGIVQAALERQDEDIGVAAPSQGMASAWHETQYTRLFRT